MSLSAQLPEAVTGGEKLTATSKRIFAERYGVSLRTCDGWLADGMPHLKLSARQVRIPIADADQWLRTHFLTQRRA